MKRFKSKIGFAVVDLLACVALGGIVVALALPAVQRTRETARRMECKHRLFNIAFGSKNFIVACLLLPPVTLNY